MKQKRYARIACTTCNAPYRRQIGEAKLVSVLRGESLVAPWESHLRVFFSEVPIEVIAGIARQHDISYDQLARLYFEYGDSSVVIEDLLGIAPTSR